jgi:uncharacterized protein
MPLSVQADLSLAFVEGVDEARMLPEALDPTLVRHGQINLRDLIEDELLLALPQVAMHPMGECALQVGAQPAPGNEPARKNPFAVLQKLKRNEK